jgi:NitT/TauT family transport system substrate-binding protein
VQSGAVDFTENTAPTVAAADHNGSHLSVIATFSYPPGEIILSKAAAAKAHITASSPMADKVRALKGQTLAVEDVGGGLQYQIDDLLQKYGVPTNSVNVVGISSFTSQLTSLQRGVIDGASIIPPFGNTAILQQGAVPVGNIWGGDVPQLSKTPYEVIDGSTSYIKAHPAIAEKVQKAFALALAWMHKQTAQVAKINEQALGGSFSAAAVEAGVGTGAGWPTSPKLIKADYDNVIAFMKVSGLAADTDVSYGTLVAPIARGRQ